MPPQENNGEGRHNDAKILYIKEVLHATVLKRMSPQENNGDGRHNNAKFLYVKEVLH